MIEVRTKKDVRLLGRAMSEGWNIDRKAVLKSLMDVMKGSDEKLRIEAASVLVRADLADVKREELELKKQALDDERRLRLLEIARHLPSGELARLASSHGYAGEAGRTDSLARTDGEKTSGRTRSENTGAKRGKPQT
jgi:hypothetical protein